MKIMIFFRLTVLLLCALTPCALGAELDVSGEMLEISVGELVVSGEVRKYLGGDAEEYVKRLESGEEDLFATIGAAVRDSMPNLLQSLFMTVCALVLSAVLGAVKRSLYTSGTTDAYDLASGLVCALLLFDVVAEACEAARVALDAVSAFMLGMTGVMCASYGLTGNIIQGGKSAGVVLLVVQTVQLITSSVLMPLVLVCFGLSLASTVSSQPHLSSFAAAVRRTVVFILTAAGVVLSFVLTTQTVLAKTAENALRKSVKFSVASFIPFVGSSLSDSFDVVFTGISTLRTVTGLSGIIVIALTVIPPLVLICGGKFICAASGGIARALSLERQARLIDDMNEILSVLLALICSCGAVLVLSCALYMKMTVG